jgi:hypothetical protein
MQPTNLAPDSTASPKSHCCNLRAEPYWNVPFDLVAARAKLASLLRTADQRKLGVYDATKKLIPDYWATGRR